MKTLRGFLIVLRLLILLASGPMALVALTLGHVLSWIARLHREDVSRTLADANTWIKETP